MGHYTLVVRAVVSACDVRLSNLLHERGARAPWVVVGGLAHLGLDLADVQRIVFGLRIELLEVVKRQVRELMAADVRRSHLHLLEILA